MARIGSMDIFIGIVSGICTVALAVLGIRASVEAPKTEKDRRNIKICSIFFAVILLFLVSMQSCKASNQQAKLENQQASAL